jgi:phage FluMu protein Com
MNTRITCKKCGKVIFLDCQDGYLYECECGNKFTVHPSFRAPIEVPNFRCKQLEEIKERMSLVEERLKILGV